LRSMIRAAAIVAAAAVVMGAALCEPAHAEGIGEGLSEFKVGLPADLRNMAGRGKLSPVTTADVLVAAPPGFRVEEQRPIMVISATSGASSRELLRAYAKAAADTGWVLVAADAEPEVARADDQVALRMALATAAIAGLKVQWPASAQSPLAFGGFSGGAKHSGWLAASFARRGRSVTGVYLSGVNEETLSQGAAGFEIKDEQFKRMRVFVQAGLQDEIAGPDDVRKVMASLEKNGFARSKISWTSGGHQVDPESLRGALLWFNSP
jgi:predicted esterase